MSSEQFPEIFCTAVELAIALGANDICKLEGCWEHQIDEHWWMAANGHNTPTPCSLGNAVPPFSIYFEFNGWPAGLCDAGGGLLAAGAIANEAALILALNDALKKAKAQP